MRKRGTLTLIFLLVPTVGLGLFLYQSSPSVSILVDRARGFFFIVMMMFDASAIVLLVVLIRSIPAIVRRRAEIKAAIVTGFDLARFAFEVRLAGKDFERFFQNSTTRFAVKLRSRNEIWAETNDAVKELLGRFTASAFVGALAPPKVNDQYTLAQANRRAREQLTLCEGFMPAIDVLLTKERIKIAKLELKKNFSPEFVAAGARARERARARLQRENEIRIQMLRVIISMTAFLLLRHGSFAAHENGLLVFQNVDDQAEYNRQSAELADNERAANEYDAEVAAERTAVSGARR